MERLGVYRQKGRFDRNQPFVYVYSYGNALYDIRFYQKVRQFPVKLYITGVASDFIDSVFESEKPPGLQRVPAVVERIREAVYAVHVVFKFPKPPKSPCFSLSGQ